MKRLAFLVVLFSFFSCSSEVSLTPEEIKELSTKDIEIIFTTTEPNYDEVMITYYDFDIGTDVAKAYVFKYDVDDNPLPIKIVFDNYEHDFLRGEGFRNNFSDAELKVQLFIDEELILEETSKGTASTFAKVDFNYDL
ncbi:hypothetical protein [Polaribacter ponticola]|uniref:Lipoprotein n=1 Tax=Polaribacter ponticola TaxID=2978475 RepID=A0ABT5SC95_9FLAO|nr:hypothetical protein [Polaribacter sp. MSW5]MDD7914897.1 hypothetical protein [Polaribacter sp. MSW5]